MLSWGKSVQHHCNQKSEPDRHHVEILTTTDLKTHFKRKRKRKVFLTVIKHFFNSLDTVTKEPIQKANILSANTLIMHSCITQKTSCGAAAPFQGKCSVQLEHTVQDGGSGSIERHFSRALRKQGLHLWSSACCKEPTAHPLPKSQS